jgi:hypothetical protein
LDAFGGPQHRRQHGQGVGLATALTDERKATQETCAVRSKSQAWQWSIRDPVYRTNTTACRSRSPSVDALRIELWALRRCSMHDPVCRLPRIHLLRLSEKSLRGLQRSLTGRPKARFNLFRPPYTHQICSRSATHTPFRTVSLGCEYPGEWLWATPRTVLTLLLGEPKVSLR